MSDTFWTLCPPAGERPNPLRYQSAHTDPSCCAASDILDFIAYGLTCCWLEKDEFPLWESLAKSDIRELRGIFLDTVEDLAMTLYAGEDDRVQDVTNDMSIGEEGSGVHASLDWFVSDQDDDAIALRLVCNVHEGDAETSDDNPIWVSRSAFQDMRYVRSAIAYARKVLGMRYSEARFWKKHNIPDVSGEFAVPEYEDRYLGQLRRWYGSKYANDHPWKYQKPAVRG